MWKFQLGMCLPVRLIPLHWNEVFSVRPYRYYIVHRRQMATMIFLFCYGMHNCDDVIPKQHTHTQTGRFFSHCKQGDDNIYIICMMSSSPIRVIILSKTRFLVLILFFGDHTNVSILYYRCKRNAVAQTQCRPHRYFITDFIYESKLNEEEENYEENDSILLWTKQ